ncbi:MAG TPA: NifU family protein [Cyclobacteriaceae bacterium]|nr:NifU family protein [Cyclobacteriaceae bacterium]
MNQLTNLYLESNPNPNSLKFVANYLLVPEGESYDFPDQESAKNAPLAGELFGYDFVKRVFYMNNFVTVTKSPDIPWEEITGKLKDHIQKYLESGKSVLSENGSDQGTPDAAQTEIDMKIIAILEEYIKPAVEMDGGAIQYQSFKDGIVKVYLQGSCNGCPSSMLTLKAGIENLLKMMVPEVKSVEAVGI